MTDNAYFNLLREELNGIYEKYDNSYESLEQNVKANTANKKYFSGSSEMLCIYEPSLIKALRCSWCLKGSFKEKKPGSKQYHLISFDDEKAIKLDFLTTFRPNIPSTRKYFSYTINPERYILSLSLQSQTNSRCFGKYIC